MQVFKYYFKILKEYKMFIILYTILLLGFGTLNSTTNSQSIGFEAKKPSVAVVNYDNYSGITKDFYDYIDSNTEIVKLDEDKLSDALFYREISYIIYIPESFSNEFMNNKEPIIEVKSTGDYTSSYAQMLVDKYFNIAKSYLPYYKIESELIKKIGDSLDTSSKVEIMSEIDTTSLNKVAFYYNFSSYSILAGSIYVISMIMFSFKQISIHKRTTISSTNYASYNRKLLLGNGVFVFALWLFYCIISVILFKDAMLSIHGLYFILNALVYSICSLCIGFLLSNAVKSKEAVAGLVNVIGLGSAFLCGAFVPMDFLPESVVKFSQILPTHWFIKNNELLKGMETINFEALKPFINNIIIMLLFSIVFVIITNIVSRKKRKIS